MPRQNPVPMTTTAFVHGFTSTAMLIMAIGAQNAFVLRQGLRREHVLPVVALCALSDADCCCRPGCGAWRWLLARPEWGQWMRWAGCGLFLLATMPCKPVRALRFWPAAGDGGWPGNSLRSKGAHAAGPESGSTPCAPGHRGAVGHHGKPRTPLGAGGLPLAGPLASALWFTAIGLAHAGWRHCSPRPRRGGCWMGVTRFA